MAKKEIKKEVKKETKTESAPYKKGDFIALLAKHIDKANQDAIGFGSFSISHREARDGRNPSTGEAIKIKASNVVKFKVGSVLKGKVNG